MKSLLKIECAANDDKLISILSYNGVVITAQQIETEILASISTAEHEVTGRSEHA